MVNKNIKNSKKFRKSTKIIGIANAFSGGIFLGIALFHLLPESVEGFEGYFEEIKYEGVFSKMPLAYIFAFCSYCLVLFVEKVAFDSHSLIDHGHDHGPANDSTELQSKRDSTAKDDKKANCKQSINISITK